MLREPALAAEAVRQEGAKPYVDPAFRVPGVCGQFLLDLHARGLVSWQTSGDPLLGCFFVQKKMDALGSSSTRAWPISTLEPPPHSQLPSACRGTSLLERIVILDSTKEDYHKRVGLFQDWLT
ncbi:MAG: hypothetical protein ACKPKO_38335, partial [Candidatus Fonsibacter sp.]